EGQAPFAPAAEELEHRADDGGGGDDEEADRRNGIEGPPGSEPAERERAEPRARGRHDRAAQVIEPHGGEMPALELEVGPAAALAPAEDEPLVEAALRVDREAADALPGEAESGGREQQGGIQLRRRGG